MRAATTRRLVGIERNLSSRQTSRRTVDLSVLPDAELARLEHYAERCQAWPGSLDDWIRQDLTSDERLELQLLCVSCVVTSCGLTRSVAQRCEFISVRVQGSGGIRRRALCRFSNNSLAAKVGS